ncbi:MAG TPA: HEAT repeat domain-containing protein, partial [Polyangia bacterium]|nr:HEAT repeat domain-containing protein [Polyangia bacterium]
LLASITPEHDRAALFRMSPLLHDPSPDIRAAAAAGVLRAAGDQGIEQLYLLARERDPRPMIAAAAELGRLRSEESATLLGKWLSRTDKAVRRAAIQALAERHDEAARALVAPVLAAALVNRDEDVAVRELALRAATPEQLAALATDPRLGRATDRAMLAANRREEAARWLVNNLDQLLPDARIAVLGEWIAEAPKAPRPVASAR